ncbi:hypothetical protein G6F46_009370 [Rhizopus delemar]|uniref:Uncharacterized protein n=2 Tax=Rhizopus TaxID=4842 RepID=A0A9P7CL82_9FUNG|nr:hypothetical protein G6F43_004549 [Rhizopus delemar]KAG1156435.1 hypothetical protein G6F36_014331 [Rhizopus arrhizus]KAG1453189.1 hypothetical protein G6F55_008272 [Rhizopus delemar]KAG1493071.1 hypothetical protein G6F54_008849 [Rhizopus delemar]KAG1507135.1 hypothetical protein G6F53_009176 [Rhizopus delemar]
MNLGNCLRQAVNHLLQVCQHILVARCHCREQGLDCEAIAIETSRTITTLARNLKEDISVRINSQGVPESMLTTYTTNLQYNASEANGFS